MSVTKESNPKDAIGIKKWRYFTTVSMTVLAEVGIAMLEGAMKYGRHNYRAVGVRSSVYVDASIGHIMQWWEGEDLDPDTKLSHITKAIASLFVLRDSMIQGNLVDDRPIKGNLHKVRTEMQDVVDEFFSRYPNPKEAYLNETVESKQTELVKEIEKAAKTTPLSSDDRSVWEKAMEDYFKEEQKRKKSLYPWHVEDSIRLTAEELEFYNKKIEDDGVNYDR